MIGKKTAGQSLQLLNKAEARQIKAIS